MARLLHVCLYNRDETASEELQRDISRLNFVRLTAEVATPEDLATAIQQHAVNLVFFHLDPAPDTVLEVIDHVSTRYPELALLAISAQTDPEAILAPMRVGCDQFVCRPVDHADLAQAVARVADKRLLSQTRGGCICVTSASGGAGSTSIACNLALEIGQLSGSTCALVDLDFQFGDVAAAFDCEPQFNFHDLAESGGNVDRSVLNSTLQELPCNVAILSRPVELEQCEAIAPDLIHYVVELLMSSYEHVVIDLPSRIDPCTLSALRKADHVLVVCQLLVPSIRNTKRYYDALANANIPEESIDIVVNRADSGSKRVTDKDLEEAIGKPIFATVPNDYRFVARSLDYGRPIAALERDNAVRTAIRDIARKLLAEDNPESGKGAGEGGFFKRLFAKPT